MEVDLMAVPLLDLVAQYDEIREAVHAAVDEVLETQRCIGGPKVAEQCTVIRNHGSKPKYYHRYVGGNFRLDAIQAAVITVKLRYLEQWHEARRANAARYDERFAARETIVTPHVRQHNRMIYNQYVIRITDSGGGSPGLVAQFGSLPRGGLPRPPRSVHDLSRRPGKAAARFGQQAPPDLPRLSTRSRVAAQPTVVI